VFLYPKTNRLLGIDALAGFRKLSFALTGAPQANRKFSSEAVWENKDVIIGRGRLDVDKSGKVFLRLQRVGEKVNAFCSADGENWFTVGYASFPVADPLQVGLVAIGAIDRTVYHGAYPAGTAIRFESFELWGE